MSDHWQSRYNKLIERCHLDRVLDYSEVHHIVPRCLGGSDHDSNLIRLTLREHFIAHYMLSKIHAKSVPLLYAYVQMCNRNKVKDLSVADRHLRSRMYANAKASLYDRLSEMNSDKVYCVDATGEKCVVSKAEFAQGDYKFHTSGMVACVDITTGQRHYVKVGEYHANSNLVIDRDPEYTYIDKLTGMEFQSKQSDFQNSSMKSEMMTIGLRSVRRYKRKIESSGPKPKNLVVVYDTTVGSCVKISRDVYHADRSRYLTNKQRTANKGKTTKGLVTVTEIATNTRVTIPVEVFNQNKMLYAGVCSGKQNVRSIHSLGNYQISRERNADEVGCAAKFVYVHNKETKETKQLARHEFVDSSWAVGKYQPTKGTKCPTK